MSGRAVPNLLNENHDQQIRVNRDYIGTVIEALLYCVRQTIGIRGHREGCTSDVIPGMVRKGCNNSGNFFELIKIIGKHDRAIATKLTEPKKNATYLSKRVQNELIITMGE